MMIDIDADTILVISYTQNKSVHNREVAIKKYLSKYNLLDNVLYLDLTDVIDRDSYIKMINDSLGLKDENIIKKVPSFIYFKDGSVELVKSLTKDNIKNLIKEYELNK